MDINKKIIDLCNERGWSIYTLALEAGITQSTINTMLHRGTPPKIETLQCICEAFGITLAQFFIDDESVELLNEREKKLITLFRRLPEKKQQAVIDLIDR